MVCNYHLSFFLTAWANAQPLIPVSPVLVNGTCIHSKGPLVPGFSARINGLNISCVQPIILASTIHSSNFLLHTNLLLSSSASYSQSNHTGHRPLCSQAHWHFLCPAIVIGIHYSFLCTQLIFLQTLTNPDFFCICLLIQFTFFKH